MIVVGVRKDGWCHAEVLCGGCVQRQGTQQGIAQAWRWSLVVQRRQREGLPHVRSCLMHADMRPQAAVESFVLHYFAHHTDTAWQTARCMATSISDLTAPCRAVWCASFVEVILISNILWLLPVDGAFSWTGETTENKRDSECWDVRLYCTSPRCIRTEGFATTTHRPTKNQFVQRRSRSCAVFCRCQIR